MLDLKLDTLERDLNAVPPDADMIYFAECAEDICNFMMKMSGEEEKLPDVMWGALTMLLGDQIGKMTNLKTKMEPSDEELTQAVDEIREAILIISKWTRNTKIKLEMVKN